jgi:hypothetical protein
MRYAYKVSYQRRVRSCVLVVALPGWTVAGIF